MRKNILMFSHNTHSFLNNEIAYAASTFNRVVVVTPYSIEIEEVTEKYSNVEYLFYDKKDLHINSIPAFLSVFKKLERDEIIESIKQKKMSLEYIKHYSIFVALERIILKVVKQQLKIRVENSEDWVFYSAWYYGTAFALAKVKEAYPSVKLVSLAHSFEIDKEKSGFTNLLFRKYYHAKLNHISFISENVYRMYKREVAEPLKLSLRNISVSYLGTKKLLPGFNLPSEDGKIRILSCSHIVAIKRLNLIFETLDNMKNVEVEWTHIGDGNEMANLKQIIDLKKNRNLTVNLLGNLKNRDIHHFYLNNPVDVFINTSASEGIPVTIMEAIAYGVPIVATDVGGNSEIVKSDFGKLISKYPSLSEIEMALYSLINISPIKKKDMRIKAQDYFNKSFNSDIIRKKFYESLSEE